MRQQHEQSEKGRPGDQPPVLGSLPDNEIKQFDHDYRQHKTHQKSLNFVPRPGPQSLVGEIEAVLQTEAVVIKAQPKGLSDQNEHHDI